MASASVVGQHPGVHRLDPEPQILILKLRGAKKRVNLPRRSSWERMALRRSSGDATGEEAKPRPLSPSAAAKGRTMPGEGCAPPAAPAAPRSAERDRTPGSADAEVRPGDSGSVHLNVHCDFNHNTCARPWRSAGSVLPIGHKEAHRQRDSPQGRRDTWSGDSRHQSILCSCSCSSALAQGGSSLPSLQRLTQGKTGVVRLARTDPPRREAWSIFPGGVDPRMMSERGEGHRFEAKPVKQDWCDSCNRQITAQALKCQKAEMAQTRNQKHQAEQGELKASVDMWRRKVGELERTLAVKEEELSNTVLKRRTRIVIHVETLVELSSTQAALKESQRKFTALEESFHTTLKEKEESYQREVKEKEKSVKQMMEEEFERELNERKQKLEDDLERKEEAMRQEQFLLEEKFTKEQSEREKQFEQEISKKEEWLEQQLRKREEDFHSQLTGMFLQWTSRAEGMGQKQKELEHQLQENIRKREQEEDKKKEEIQRLSEEISQLQHQMEKKKKKCFLMRLWEKLKLPNHYIPSSV